MDADPAHTLARLGRHTTRTVWTRRSFLSVGAAAAASGLLAACASPAPPSSPTAAPPAGAAEAAKPTTAAAAPAAAASGQSAGQLRLAIDAEFPATLDATKNGYQLVRLGLAETLTRLTPKMQLVPWLAKDLTNVDPSTWRVTLRPNAKFWDGSPVTAQDVMA